VLPMAQKQNMMVLANVKLDSLVVYVTNVIQIITGLMIIALVCLILN